MRRRGDTRFSRGSQVGKDQKKVGRYFIYTNEGRCRLAQYLPHLSCRLDMSFSSLISTTDVTDIVPSRHDWLELKLLTWKTAVSMATFVSLAEFTDQPNVYLSIAHIVSLGYLVSRHELT